MVLLHLLFHMQFCELILLFFRFQLLLLQGMVLLFEALLLFVYHSILLLFPVYSGCILDQRTGAGDPEQGVASLCKGYGTVVGGCRFGGRKQCRNVILH